MTADSSSYGATAENEAPGEKEVVDRKRKEAILRQLIEMCVLIDQHLQHALGKCKKARKAFLRTIATGSVMGVVGGILSTSGLILAPSTGGVSLLLASAGFGLLSSTLIGSAVFTNERYTKKWIGKLVEKLGEWQKLDKEYRKWITAAKADKATGFVIII